MTSAGNNNNKGISPREIDDKSQSKREKNHTDRLLVMR